MNSGATGGSPRGISTLVSTLQEDLAANQGHWERAGFHALVVYRFGSWAQEQRGLVALTASILYRIAFGLVRNLYSIDIARGTKVGRRLKIPHPAGIVIISKAEIGDDCTILQNVTIGMNARRKGGRRPQQAPRIGDRVQIGAGAVIVGGITIGDDARIGPNSVIMTDVPPGATAFAPPTKIMRSLDVQRQKEHNSTVEGEPESDG